MEEEITARVVGAVAESESHGKLLRFVLLFWEGSFTVGNRVYLTHLQTDQYFL